MVTENIESESVETTEVSNPSVRDIIDSSISEVESSRVVDKEENTETLEVESAGRDEKGRFIKKESQEVPTQEVVPQQEPVTKYEPPQKWRSEYRPVFSKLPPEGQEAILAREKDFETFERTLTSRMMRAENVAKQFEEVVKPYGYLLEKYECSVPGAVDKLFYWQERLETDPENTLHDMAASYGFEIEIKNRPQVQHFNAQEEKYKYELEKLKQERDTQLRELQSSQYKAAIQAWAVS